MATSRGDASKASKLLSNPKTPKVVKSVAASDLAQASRSRKAKAGSSSPQAAQRRLCRSTSSACMLSARTT